MPPRASSATVSYDECHCYDSRHRATDCLANDDCVTSNSRGQYAEVSADRGDERLDYLEHLVLCADCKGFSNGSVAGKFGYSSEWQGRFCRADVG